MKGTLTTLILGAALAEFGLTGLQHEDGSSYQPAEQASAVCTQADGRCSERSALGQERV